MSEVINRKRNHEEMSHSNEGSRIKADGKDLLDLVEDGKSELEKVMAGFRNPNKLTSVKQYLQRKATDLTHLTVEARVIEQVMMKKKEDMYHYVFLVHLNAVNVQAYFYFIHSESNIMEEGEVYILQNINCFIQNSDYIMLHSNEQTQVV